MLGTVYSKYNKIGTYTHFGTQTQIKINKKRKEIMYNLQIWQRFKGNNAGNYKSTVGKQVK